MTTAEEKTTIYSQDGVNIEEGDKFSQLAGRICTESFKNSPFVDVRSKNQYFRGHRSFTLRNLPFDSLFTMGADGNGTKVIFTVGANMPGQSANDLLAMTAMDFTRNGCLPLVFVNVLDVKSLGKEGDDVNNFFCDLITGLGEAAKKIDVVLFRGETAELNVCIGSEIPEPRPAFNWSGSMWGVTHPSKEITGENVKVGQAVVALWEKGFGANGISSVRPALQIKFGKEWWNNPEAQDAIKKAAEPCVLYDKFLAEMNGWYSRDFEPKIKMHAIAHITGGGIPGKFGEDILFPKGLSANLGNLFAPPPIMKECFEWRGITDEEAYRVWNGGQRALVVLDNQDVIPFCESAKLAGIEAKQCGTIYQAKVPQLLIRSKFTGKELQFTENKK